MKYDLATLRGDIFGGVTSMVVALPVALGFGIASGMGAAAGLYGAIAVGFFASVFGGTRSQISGPTAPMTVAMAVVLTSYAGSLAEALTVVVLAGLLQVLLGLSKIGRFVAYTPSMVVSGFMSGIGIIIMLMQTLPLLGASGATGGPMGAARALPEAVENIDTGAFAIGAVSLAVGFLWPRRFSRFAPGPLVALVAGTALGIFWLTDAPVIGAIPTGLPALQIGLPSAGFLLQALEPAIILALLGSVDSLLTSLVADSLTGNRHNPDRELVGQGIGNMVAGLFGALPGAGATMGTVTNIRSGGSTPVSGVLRALLLLALVLGLGGFVEPIPLAALAGVLMKVGWDIIDWRLLRRVHRLRREHLFIMLTTLCLTVFIDLITAVAIGLIAGGMVHARRLERLELDSVVSVPILDTTFFPEDTAVANADPLAAQVGMVALRGSLTVASSHKLVSVIGPDIREHEVVIFDFSGTAYIDDSAAVVIEQLLDVAAGSGTACVAMGLAGDAAATLATFGTLRDVPQDRIVGTLGEARRVARDLLAQAGAPPADDRQP
ncbi:MAG: SulP family inorganic anion transporter [Rhodospirillaceae bacterium]|nr:SulP family inorganic anion transporter [Rhodospirillaceae bacterium]MYH36562.1 SulP family inorganic anion transporter [Rhodospirillaceae bacterium]MYK16473.1 SulP family inorganic anion transporter [Rhodospirillaceae bacterium]